MRANAGAAEQQERAVAQAREDAHRVNGSGLRAWTLVGVGVAFPDGQEWLRPTPDRADEAAGDRTARRGDDRFCNLRPANGSQNSINRDISPKNRSGCTGVHCVGRGRMARITRHGVRHYLGTWPTREEAVRARLAAELHKDGDWRPQLGGVGECCEERKDASLPSRYGRVKRK